MKHARLKKISSAAVFKNISKKISALDKLEKSIPAMLIIHHIKDSTVVYMSKRATATLGVTLKELRQMGTEYYTRFFNPEDAKDYVPKIMGLLERNNDNDLVSYFQQVRRSPEHAWSWYLSATMIFCRDENGDPLLTLTTAIPIDAQHHIAAKAERLLAENNFLRNNAPIYNTLTIREKEILAMLARGESSADISKKLFISELTANTHRKNIKRKLKAETSYDLIKFAQAFDLI